MAEELSALTLLGDSADWLKDAAGTAVREHRVAALEAYRAAWMAPADEGRFAAEQAAFARLFQALHFNHLYPDGAILGQAPDKSPRYLAAAPTIRKDFDQVQRLCVINKFGIGEVQLLHVTLLLCRMLHQPMRAAYDRVTEDALGDILFLRVPVYRADNLGPFSSEARARFHAVRVMRCMRTLGLLDDAPLGEISTQDQAEAREVILTPLRRPASRYILRASRLAFSIFDAATALEEFARAHAASRASVDDRSPEELFLRLRHRLKQIPDREDIGEACRTRLTNLGIAAATRALAHVDAALARTIYAFLRSGKYHATIRHSRMFALLPNEPERLRLLNFLFTHGKQNPVYYIEKFQKYFAAGKLRFASKDAGFVLEGAPPSA